MRFHVPYLVASFGWAIAATRSNGIGEALTFSPEGTFQIAIFEDLHYGEAPATYGPTQDALTTRTVAGILDAETADFVVINGDTISRDNLMSNSTGYLDQALTPFLERNLTWAMLYGNHESNRARNVEDVFAREQRYPNARTRSMLSDHQRVGVTNYYLPVFGADCPSGCGCEPELIIWFFDSRGGFNYNETNDQGAQVTRETWVHPGVIEWFVTERESIASKYTRTIPSLAFVHIPIHAYYAIQTGPGVDPQRNPGANTNFEIGQSAGFCSDGVRNGTCPYGGLDIPFMQSLVTTPGLMGLFVAHLHGNSWCYKWTDETLPGYPVQPDSKGINICFGQRSGFGGSYEAQRGSRQVLLRQDGIINGEFETWVRLQTGEVVGEVSLNATYNEDIYPEAPYRESFCEECFQWDDYKPNIPN
ncbi:Metallo-dependent phosphatase-like protein [Stachybotrys elegans]|uniref:Metallo-dependent phosphatase-like protein n=1 Tax=Stachybotrys elegans TaxID=80388 RepID=A0A8K0STY9_9HYPO|nr:Metallo-dependent phosphatase-like protein [Stachybotrys elegans]